MQQTPRCSSNVSCVKDPRRRCGLLRDVVDDRRSHELLTADDAGMESVGLEPVTSAAFIAVKLAGKLKSSQASKHNAATKQAPTRSLQKSQGDMSDSFESDAVDVTSLLPANITDSVAEQLFAVSTPSTTYKVPLKLVTELDNAVNQLSAELPNEPYAFKDKTKFLFEDWHFAFSPAGSSACLSTSAELSQSSVSEGALSLLSCDPTAAFPPITSPRHNRRGVSEPTLSPTIAPTPPPHPLSFVHALGAKLCSKCPKTLTVEHLPLGSSPSAVCALLFRYLKPAPSSLRRLHLSFCDLSTSTMLLLLSGLHNAYSTHNLLTELDVSYNKLTAHSLPVLCSMLPYTRILSLSLHGNPIGQEATTTVQDIIDADKKIQDVSRQSETLTVRQNSKDPLRLLNESVGTAGVSSSSTTTTGAQKLTTQFERFVRETMPRLESLDIGFTQLSPTEQTECIAAIQDCTFLRALNLDGLRLTPNNAAKLAVAVANSTSLWSVSVNFNISCSARQYADKLKSFCATRHAQQSVLGSPSSRNRSSISRRSTSVFSPLRDRRESSSGESPKKSQVTLRAIDIEGVQCVDETALSEGYAAFTTNDPSLRRTKSKSGSLSPVCDGRTK